MVGEVTCQGEIIVSFNNDQSHPLFECSFLWLHDIRLTDDIELFAVMIYRPIESLARTPAFQWLEKIHSTEFEGLGYVVIEEYYNVN